MNNITPFHVPTVSKKAAAAIATAAMVLSNLPQATTGNQLDQRVNDSKLIVFSHPDPAKKISYSISQDDLKAAVAQTQAKGFAIFYHAHEKNPFYAIREGVNLIWQKVMGKISESDVHSRSWVVLPDGTCYILFNRRKKGGDGLVGQGSAKIVTRVVRVKFNTATEKWETENCVSASIVREVECDEKGAVVDPQLKRMIAGNKDVGDASVERELNGLFNHSDIPGLLQGYHRIDKYDSKVKTVTIDGVDRHFKLVKCRIFLPLGESLAAVSLFLSPEKKVNIALEVLETIAALNKKGIVHHDLKLENVLLLKNQTETRVTDMGQSFSINSKENNNTRATISSIPYFYAKAYVDYLEACEKYDSCNKKLEELKQQLVNLAKESMSGPVNGQAALEKQISMLEKDLPKLKEELSKKCEILENTRNNGKYDAGSLGFLFLNLFGGTAECPWDSELRKRVQKLNKEALKDCLKKEIFKIRMSTLNQYFDRADSNLIANLLGNSLKKYPDNIKKAIINLINNISQKESDKGLTAEEALIRFQCDLRIAPKARVSPFPSAACTQTRLTASASSLEANAPHSYL